MKARSKTQEPHTPLLIPSYSFRREVLNRRLAAMPALPIRERPTVFAIAGTFVISPTLCRNLPGNR